MAIGSATIPDSQPGESVNITIALDRPMPDVDYDVSVLRSVWSPDAEVKVTDKQTQQVTVSVTSPAGKAGAAVLHVICTRQVLDLPPVTVPPAKRGKPA